MESRSMRLELRLSALGALKSMPISDAKSLMSRLEDIAVNANHGAADIHPVEGYPGTFLFRHDEWVVMYELDTVRGALYIELISVGLGPEIEDVVLDRPLMTKEAGGDPLASH